MGTSSKITFCRDVTTEILISSEVPMKVTAMDTVFWDATPCTLVEVQTGLGGGRRYTPPNSLVVNFYHTTRRNIPEAGNPRNFNAWDNILQPTTGTFLDFLHFQKYISHRGRLRSRLCSCFQVVVVTDTNLLPSLLFLCALLVGTFSFQRLTCPLLHLIYKINILRHNDNTGVICRNVALVSISQTMAYAQFNSTHGARRKIQVNSLNQLIFQRS